MCCYFVYVLLVCCVLLLYYCHRAQTQLQINNNNNTYGSKMTVLPIMMMEICSPETSVYFYRPPRHHNQGYRTLSSHRSENLKPKICVLLHGAWSLLEKFGWSRKTPHSRTPPPLYTNQSQFNPAYVITSCLSTTFQ
jgi:hypothetical protein